MNNYTINMAVAKKFYGYVAFKQEYDAELEKGLDGVYAMTECCESFFHDFCNNPGDAWPIIKHYKIQLNHESENPLREAMLHYLDMDQE